MKGPLDEPLEQMKAPSIHLAISTLCACLLFTSGAAVADELLSALNTTSGQSRLPNAQNGDAFIDSINKAAEALNDYSVHYSNMAFKNGSSDTQQGTFYYRKPRLIRVEISSGSKKGSVAVLMANGNVKAHLGGALRGFKMTLDPNSDMLKSANGHRMVDGDFVSLYAYLKGMLKEGDHSLVTKEPVAEDQLKPCYILDIYNKSDALEKRIFVDPSTKMPTMWLDYTRGKLSARSYWEGLKTNTGLCDKLFTL